MQSQAAHLSDGDKQHIVEYITQMRLGDPAAGPEVAWCDASASLFTSLEESQLTGWGHDTRRYVSSEAAGFDRSQIGDLELKWSFGFPASTRARSQPTIAMGAVFVGSQDGTVYAFDLETGCVRWTYAARAEVRTALPLANAGPMAPPQPILATSSPTFTPSTLPPASWFGRPVPTSTTARPSQALPHMRQASYIYRCHRSRWSPQPIRNMPAAPSAAT